MKASVPTAPLTILEALRRNGHEAWLVGGGVRDLLLKRPPKDWDIVTSAHPEEIEATFPRTVAIGKAFGIITVVLPDHPPVDVATFRADSTYADGRHPQGITFTNAREDALRRDFTINALLYDPATDTIRDYVNGQADLHARLIRAIGDPRRRFQEDHLRMLRAVRFAATLGFTIEPATADAIRELAPHIRRISAERIRDELFRLLTEARPAGAALQMLHDTGLLAKILPEVTAMIGVEQPPEFHPEGDVFTHTRLMLDLLPPHPPLALALAVLLHDVGKPPTANYATLPDGTQRWRFENHAAIGADMSRAILERLRAPHALIEDVVTSIAGHMRISSARQMRPAKLRRLLGSPTFDLELELHRLDCLSSHAQLDVYDFLTAQKAEYAAEPILPAPIVTGRDLIACGHTPGPAFSSMLKAAYDRQLEGVTDKNALLEPFRKIQ
ncbi:MAG: CCA tRNA nucleotidyltransferase [Kiritimatiellia bacterium]